MCATMLAVHTYGYRHGSASHYIHRALGARALGGKACSNRRLLPDLADTLCIPCTPFSWNNS